MLIIPDSIYQKELKKLNKYFSLEDIKKMAKKVILGLGSSLAKTPKGRIVKIKTTFKGVAGRAIFFVVTKTSAIFPVIVRLKKDPLGENLSFKNKTFQEVFDQNYQLIEDDLVNDRFEIYEI